jgi:hypothetical protein
VKERSGVSYEERNKTGDLAALKKEADVVAFAEKYWKNPLGTLVPEHKSNRSLAMALDDQMKNFESGTPKKKRVRAAPCELPTFNVKPYEELKKDTERVCTPSL